MPEPTPEQLELTNAILERVTSTDWSGDIDPYADEIVSLIKRLLDMDSERVDFVTIVRDQSIQWSLAAWSENLAPTIRDSSWSRLADRLETFVPSDT